MMHTPASSRFRRFLLFVLLFGLGLSVRAAESDRDALIVADGRFSHDGKTETSTLKNLIEFIRGSYPKTNITMVGVEDIQVNDVTVAWRSYSRSVGEPQMKASLFGVLTALAEASNRQFEVVSFNETDFLLRRPGGSPQSSKPTVRVFNLRGLTGRRAEITRELENAVEMAKAERLALVKRFTPEHPRVQDQDVRIQTLEAQAAMSRQPPPNQEQVLKDIQEAVALALAQTAPGEKAPDFKYHAGTNLLIVTGNEIAVDTARMVIDALVKNP